MRGFVAPLHLAWFSKPTECLVPSLFSFVCLLLLPSTFSQSLFCFYFLIFMKHLLRSNGNGKQPRDERERKRERAKKTVILKILQFLAFLMIFLGFLTKFSPNFDQIADNLSLWNDFHPRSNFSLSPRLPSIHFFFILILKRFFPFFHREIALNSTFLDYEEAHSEILYVFFTLNSNLTPDIEVSDF